MQERSRELTGQATVFEDLDRGFGRTGIQSFALEGILGELQVCQRIHAALSYCKHCLALAHTKLPTACQHGQHSVPAMLQLSFTAYVSGGLDTLKQHLHKPLPVF